MSNTWYRVSTLLYSAVAIKPYEVVSHTPRTIKFLDEGYERKESKETEAHSWFITEEGAKAYASKVARDRIKQYRGFIEGLKKSAKKHKLDIGEELD